MSNIAFISLETEDDLKQHSSDIRFLYNFLPDKVDFGTFLTFLRQRLGSILLVHVDKIPLMGFVLGVNKNSVQLHLVARQDKVVPFQNKIKISVQSFVFDLIFNELGKHKVIIKIGPKDYGAIGFARFWGFEKLQNTDHGQYIYKLTKLKYEQKVNSWEHSVAVQAQFLPSKAI